MSDDEPVQGPPTQPRARSTARSERTRKRLLEAAEEVFGRRGYHDASIVEITQLAGIAQGTFYLYFPSKLSIFQHLIRLRGEELRSILHDAMKGGHGRAEVERAGFRAYFRWIAEHPLVYRVARQADYIDPELMTEWYRVFANEYRRALERAMDARVIARTDAEVLAWSLMGMADAVAMRFVIWEGKDLPREQLDAFVDIAMRAMAAYGATRAPGERLVPTSESDSTRAPSPR